MADSDKREDNDGMTDAVAMISLIALVVTAVSFWLASMPA